MSSSWFSVSCLAATIALTLGVRDYCIDNNGNQKAVGVEWYEGVKRCSCIVPQSVLYSWDGTNPSDVIKHCFIDEDGCAFDPNVALEYIYFRQMNAVAEKCDAFRNKFNSRTPSCPTVVRNDEAFKYGDEDCVCHSGSRPLADTWTSYHAVCRRANGLSYDLDFDVRDY